MSAWTEALIGIVNQKDLELAKKEEFEGKNPFEFLINSNLISKKNLLLKLSLYYKLPSLELEHYHPEAEVLRRIPEEISRRFSILPLFILKNKLYVAFSNLENLEAQDYLRQLTGLTIEPILSILPDIETAINRNYLAKEQAFQTMKSIAGKKQEEEKTKEIKKDVHIEDQEAPVIKLVNYIFSQAVNLDASDIHIEPFSDKAILRYRIDGILHEFPAPPLNLILPIISRIKVISGLNIAEHRLPQDGRASIKINDQEYDLRIAVIPNIYGEEVSIRLLNPKSLLKNLEELGFSIPMLNQYKQIIKKPYGLVLVTGPTGSGKTTTQYATLKYIYKPEKKIITIEDPVEYHLEGITQIQVQNEIDFTFTKGLRSILRQDPDIIMLGEIRDSESAEIAMQASLTGHLVLSTLHTNDSISAITRLLDMGIQSYLLFSSLSAVLAQRLLRRLCPNCKTEFTPDLSHFADLGINIPPKETIFYKPKGCTACENMGYKGRIAIFELLEITPQMRRLQLNQITQEEIKKIALMEQNFVSLRHSAIEKLFAGITSLDEVLNLTIEE